jgi:myosin heavy subunit
MANKVTAFELRFEGFSELVQLNDELKQQKKILEDLRKIQGITSDEYKKQADEVGKLQAAIKSKKLEQSAEVAEMKKANKEAEKASEISAKLSKEIEKEVSAYDELKQSLSKLEKEYKNLAVTEGTASDSAIEYRENIEKLKKQLSEIDGSLNFKKIAAENDKATQAAKRNVTQSEKQVSAYKQKSDTLNMLRNDFKNLAASEKGTTKAATDLLREIQKLDKELKNIDKSVGQSQRNVGNYQSAFQGVSSLMSGDLSQVLGSTAVGMAAVAAIEIGTEIITQVNEITTTFRNLRGEIQQLTGTTGEDLDGFTSQIAALASTFGVDTNEVLLAANSLTEQLTGDFSESLSLIKDGFLAGAGANGEFLQTLKEYPTFFKDAGIEGEQFVSIITQQLKSGVFSDKGVDAFKEATLSLRELTPAAQLALSGIGISSDAIKKEITENGIGGAIEVVTKKMATLKKDSPEVGAVLADVFKGAGEDAGFDFIVKSFSDVNKGMIDMIDTSNPLVARQVQMYEANLALSEAQNELTTKLGESGINFEALGVQIKTAAIEGLVDLIDILKTVFSIFEPFINLISDLASEFGGLEGKTFALSSVMTLIKTPFEIVSLLLQNMAKLTGLATSKVRQLLEFTGLLSEKEKENTKGKKDNAEATKENTEEKEKEKEETKKQVASLGTLTAKQKKLKDEIIELKIQGKSYTKQMSEYNAVTKQVSAATGVFSTRTRTARKEVKLQEGSMAFLRKQISDLNKEIDNTSDENVLAAKIKELLNSETELETLKSRITAIKKELEDPVPVELISLDLSKTNIEMSLALSKKMTQDKIATNEDLMTKSFASLSSAERQVKANDDAFEIEANRTKLFTILDDDKANLIEKFRAFKELKDNDLLSDEERGERLKGLVKVSAQYGLEVASSLVTTISTMQDAAQAKELKAAGDNQEQIDAINIKFAKKKQKTAIAQALISGAEGIVRTGATLGYPIAIPFQILQGIQTLAQVATIRSQQFATGGKVGESNMARQSNGDSVLATLKPNEVVLTEFQQAMLGGSETFRNIGVQGFSGGGLVRPNVTPAQSNRPLSIIENQNNNQNVLDLIKATNARMDRFTVIANASELVSTGERQKANIRKVEF